MENIGILDPEGINNNPLTGLPYTEQYLNLSKIWSKFPVYKKRNEFINAISKNQVLLVKSGTGSGKTVLVPKFALHANNYEGRIAVTIPKQISVREAAVFSAKCMDVKLGEEVGYKYRGSPEGSKSSKTKLLYITDGSIVAQLMRDPTLSNIDTLIIDEAHERNVQIDFLLLLIKKALTLRNDLKLIIMSATINTDIFVNYFSNIPGVNFNDLDAGSESFMGVEDRYFPIEVSYRDYLDVAVSIVVDILKGNEDGDILVFVTSNSDANKGCALLRNQVPQLIKNTSYRPYCVELSAKTSNNQKDLATKPDLYKSLPNDYNRKIVFSTNVAESSVTVDGIKHVIESGLEFEDSYDPKRMMRKLETNMISNAQRMQRRGRTGRTSKGICYYLYTIDQMNNMKKFPVTQIQKSDLSTDILRLFNLPYVNNISDLHNILNELIEPPSDDIRTAAIKILQEGVGALRHSNDELVLSRVGRKILRFGGSISPMAAKMLLYAHDIDCLLPATELVSILEVCDGKVNDIFISFKENKSKLGEYEYLRRKNDYQSKMSKFSHYYGDLITLYRIYQAYLDKKSRLNSEELKNWCVQNYIHQKNIEKVSRMVKKLKSVYKQVFHKEKKVEWLGEEMEGGDPQSTINVNKLPKYNIYNITPKELKKIDDLVDEDKLLLCFAIGYGTQMAYKVGNNKYRNCFPIEKTSGDISKDSFLKLYTKNMSRILYYELASINKMIKYNIVSTIPSNVYELFTNILIKFSDKCEKETKSSPIQPQQQPKANNESKSRNIPKSRRNKSRNNKSRNNKSKSNKSKSRKNESKSRRNKSKSRKNRNRNKK